MNILPVIFFIFVMSVTLLIGGVSVTSALAGLAVWTGIVLISHVLAS